MTSLASPRTRLIVRSAIAGTALLTLTVGCGSSSKSGVGSNSPTSAGTASDTITIKDFAYNDLTVKPGATVTVINKDTAGHSATAEDKSFDSGVLGKDKSMTITAPTKDGKYTLLCTVHPSMKGSLTVAG